MSLLHHPLMAQNMLSLKRRFGVHELFIFLVVELVGLIGITILIVTLSSSPFFTLLVPMLASLLIATFFIIDKYRELEIKPDTLIMSHWGKRIFEIKKEDISDIIVNFGLNLKPTFSNIHHQYTHYLDLMITLKTGKQITKYKLNNAQFINFKDLLLHFNYPPILEVGRNKFTKK